MFIVTIQNPLMRRVIEVFDSDCSGDVDFKEFVLGLAEITCDPSADWDRKLRSVHFFVGAKKKVQMVKVLNLKLRPRWK